MFQVGDKVQFQWVHLHTGVVTGVIDDRYPIEVTLDQDSEYHPDRIVTFASDGAFVGGGEPILEHRPLLGGSYPDFTVAELDGTRMVMLGTWRFADGSPMDDFVWANEYQAINILFKP